MKHCFLQSPMKSQVSAMGVNTLSRFTKPFLSWVATRSMSLIYHLDRKVSEGMLVSHLGLKMWQNPGGQAIFQECRNRKFMGKSELIKILLIFVSSNQGQYMSSVLQMIVWRICLLQSINWIFSSFSKYWWCYNLDLNMQWDTPDPSERTAFLLHEKF